MLFFLTWSTLSIAAGMFASIRRNRSGFGWFLFALFFSPAFAFIFVAILREKAPSPQIWLSQPSPGRR